MIIQYNKASRTWVARYNNLHALAGTSYAALTGLLELMRAAGYE